MQRSVVVFCFALLLGNLGCPGDAAPECTSAIDCSPGFACRDDRCVIDDGEGEGEGEGTEGEGEAGEGEGEGNVEDCPDARIICDTDRVCSGGFCDKEDDGDDVPAVDDLLGCCVRILCFGDEDCAAGEQCDTELGVCAAPLACNPNAQVGEQGCTDTNVCFMDDDGVATCATGPIPAASCRIWPPVVSVHESPDRPLLFHVVTMDAQGAQVPHTRFDVTWSASGGTIQGVGDWTAPACDAPGPGDPALSFCAHTISASVNGAACTADARVFDTLAAGLTRVVVVDRATGAPLASVPVVVVDGNTDPASVVEVVTNADGVVVAPVAVPAAISAFPDDVDRHAWLSAIAPPRDALFALDVDVDLPTQAAGVKGRVDFSRVSTLGDISLGFAGAALADLTSVARGRFFGFDAEYNIELEGITDPGGQLTSMTSGTVLLLGNSAIKGEFVSLAAAPTFDASTGAVWALGARLPLAEIGPIIAGIAGGGDLATLDGAILEIKPPANAALITGLDFAATDAPSFDGTTPPLYEAWDLPEVDIAPFVLARPTESVTSIELPCRSGATSCGDDEHLEGALVVVAGIVPGAGIVPLGARIANDVPTGSDGQDGIPDGVVSGAGAGLGNAMRAAPLHSGMEGSEDVLVIVAAFDTSALVNIERAVSISRASVGGTPLPLLPVPSGTFTAGASFAHNDVTGAGGGGPVVDNPAFRVVFDDGNGRTWSVWFPSAGTTVDVAALHPDGVAGGAAAAAARSARARIESFAMSGFITPNTHAELFGLNSPGALTKLVHSIAATASRLCDVDGACP